VGGEQAEGDRQVRLPHAARYSDILPIIRVR
jgi:hypothetical protein